MDNMGWGRSNCRSGPVPFIWRRWCVIIGTRVITGGSRGQRQDSRWIRRWWNRVSNNFPGIGGVQNAGPSRCWWRRQISVQYHEIVGIWNLRIHSNCGVVLPINNLFRIISEPPAFRRRHSYGIHASHKHTKSLTFTVVVGEYHPNQNLIDVRRRRRREYKNLHNNGSRPISLVEIW